MTWWTDLMLDMYKTTGLLVLEEDIRDLMRSVQKGDVFLCDHSNSQG